MSGKPIRVQLSRAKGWRMPPNTVKVDRTTKWGNPFRIENEEGFVLITPWPDGEPYRDLHWDEAPAFVVRVFRERCTDMLPDLAPLRGKNLACWCPLDQPCHADVLLELANKETDA